MKILVDSNILVRAADPGDPQCQVAQDSTTKLLQKKEQLCLVPQNYYEFWVVATRPTSVNGLGFTAVKAQAEVAKFRRMYLHLDESAIFFAEWEALVSRYSVIGKTAQDARLVAAMIVHGITHLLTFNQQDFQRFTNITALTPADVLALP